MMRSKMAMAAITIGWLAVVLTSDAPYANGSEPTQASSVRRPDIWFAPTDNITQRGKDFPSLFEHPHLWLQAAERVSVFAMPYDYLIRSPRPIVQKQLAWIKSQNMKLSVSVAALPVDKKVCGDGVEGNTWPGEAAEQARNLKSLGADIDYFAFDLPMTSGHLYKGPKACRLSIEDTASRLVSAIRQYQQIYPAAQFVDAEVPTGMPASEWGTTLISWLDAYKKSGGPDFYGFTMDAWWDFQWRDAARATAVILSARRIRTGIFLDADGGSNVAAGGWIASAKQNACDLQSTKIPIDYIVIANWLDMQVKNLPERDSTSLTGFLRWITLDEKCPQN